MITTLFLYIIYAFVFAITSPFRLLSDVAANSDVAAAIATASTYIKALDTFIPTATLFAVFATVLVVEGYIFGYKGVMWIIKRLPTQS